MSDFWVGFLTSAPITFFICLIYGTYIYRKGYRVGANWVLSEWKKTNEMSEDDE